MEEYLEYLKLRNADVQSKRDVLDEIIELNEAYAKINLSVQEFQDAQFAKIVGTWIDYHEEVEGYTPLYGGVAIVITDDYKWHRYDGAASSTKNVFFKGANDFHFRDDYDPTD